MISLIKNIFSSSYKIVPKKVIFIFFLICFSMIIELLSVATIIPTLTVILDQNKFINYLSFPGINLINNISSENIVHYFLFFFSILIFVRYLLSILTDILLVSYSRKIETDLLGILMQSHFESSWKKLLLEDSSKFSKSMLSDIGNYVNTGILPIINLLRSLLVILILFFFLISQKGLIVVQIFFVAIFFFYILIKISKSRLSKASKRNNSILEGRYKFIAQIVNGYREIRILQLHKHFINKYLNNEYFFTRLEVFKKLVSILPKYLIELLLILSVITLIIFNLDDFQSAIPFVALIAFVGLRCQPLFIHVATSIANIQVYKDQLNIIQEKIDKIIKDKQQIQQKKIQRNLFKQKKINLIEFKNVSFSYDDHSEILKNINIKFEKGNIYGIKGVNGSGKSTLTDLLTGLLEPNIGSIFADEILIKDDPHSWQNNVSYLSQSFFLFNDSIKNNITLNFENNQMIDKNLYESSIKKTKLNDLVDQKIEGDNFQILDFGKNLSGGQRQKIALSRLLYKNSNIIIMDEASSAMDQQSSKNINDLLQSIKKDKIIIIISHSKTDLDNCDIVFEIKNCNLVVLKNI
jgi:ATP-binding cassette, subfamily B, bacterial PglK